MNLSLRGLLLIPAWSVTVAELAGLGRGQPIVTATVDSICGLLEKEFGATLPPGYLSLLSIAVKSTGEFFLQVSDDKKSIIFALTQSA